MKIIFVGLSVLTVVGASCKSRDDGLGSNLQSGIPSSQKVIAGTDEAADYKTNHPALNEEWAYDQRAEEIEFSILSDMVRLMQETLRPQHTPASDKPLRAFHAKAHGCMAAQFYVVDRPVGFPSVLGSSDALVQESRVGIYGNKYGGQTKGLPAGMSRMFPGLVRFSNAQGKRNSDSSPDGKGLALKLFVQDANGNPSEQDFTMSDTPICNAATASRFMAFGAALAGLQKELKTMIPAGSEMQPGTAEEMLKNIDNFSVMKTLKDHLAFKQQQLGEKFPPSMRFLLTPDNGATRTGVLEILSGAVNKLNPAKLQYWSRTPYRLGKRAVKYSFIPRDCCAESSGFGQIANCPQQSQVSSGSAGGYYDYVASGLQAARTGFQTVKTMGSEQLRRITDPNSYRTALSETAKTAPICFDFAYQFQTDPATQPTENPTVVWDSRQTPPVVFAKVVLPAQTFDSGEQALACEQLGWSPEHFLPEHQPMGHLNRARLEVYRASREFRNDKTQPRSAREFPVTLITK